MDTFDEPSATTGELGPAFNEIAKAALTADLTPRKDLRQSAAEINEELAKNDFPLRLIHTQ